MAGDLTDVPGIRVGHWTDHDGSTGCTVVLLPDDGAVASVDVRGAAPGTRETDVLQPGNQVQVAHALLLSGGSAFGLAAADGVMRRLEERGVGVPTPSVPVPIVPSAVVFDLATGTSTARPDAGAGYSAALAAEAGEPCGHGRIGAGTGATVGKLYGPEDARPGGIGTASLPLPGGGIVAAVAVVNAVGDVLDEDGTVLAGPGTAQRILESGAPGAPPIGTNTTLVVLVTDVTLTKVQAHRLAVTAHDGLALSIRPVHTAYDGDTVFVASTGTVAAGDTSLLLLQTAAVKVVATAIRSAVDPSG
jgi:L-aminopeptidase/D-esterase-like protein